MDGVPASLDLLGAVSSFLDEDDSGESVIQIPQVHGGNPALEIPAREREGGGGASVTAPGQSERGGVYSQVSVLVEGVVSLHLQLAQTSRGHGAVVDRRLVFITPRRSETNNHC